MYFSGDHCEESLPPPSCVCPSSQVCVPQQPPPGYICLPSISPPCAVNHTCPPSITSSIYSITWEEFVAICIAVTSIIFLVILFIIYRYFLCLFIFWEYQIIKLYQVFVYNSLDDSKIKFLRYLLCYMSTMSLTAIVQCMHCK